MHLSRGPRATFRRFLPIAVAICVAAPGLVQFGTSRSGPHAGPEPAIRLASGLPRSAALPRAGVVAPQSAPSSWAGTTLATLLPNYNASLPGDFRSLVEDWQVGSPAVVSATKTVWWPEYPVSVGGSPAPGSAPTLVYDLSSNAFVGIDPFLANASAIVYDPGTKLLYATEPYNNSVETVNASTGIPTGVSYPVGSTPMAILYDTITKDLFVANSGSSNITVINPRAEGSSAIPWPGISVKKEPIALADDPRDKWVYVANAGSLIVSRLNTSNLSEPSQPTTLAYGPASGIAFSELSDSVAVCTASATDMTMLNGTTGASFPSTVSVGQGCRSITTAQDGALFVVANSSGDSLVTVNTSYPFNVSASKVIVGDEPTQLAPLSSKGAILVWNNGSRTVSTVNSAVTHVTATTPTLGPEPELLAYDPTDHALVVGDAALPGLEIVDPFTGVTLSLPTLLSAPPLAFAFDPSDAVLYVALSGEVQAYNISTDSLVVQNVTLSGENGPLVFDPANNLLWVGRSAQAEVIALNATTLRGESAKANVQVSSTDPASLVLDPSSGSVLAVNSSSGLVQQFSGTYGTPIGSPVSAGANVTALAWDPADGLVYAAGDNLAAIAPGTMTLNFSSVPLATHTHVGAIVYEPSRQAIYVGTWTSSPYSGSLSVVNGSTPEGARDSLTVLPTGFEPASLVAVEGPAGGLADSGVVLSANAVSGTVSVVASPPQIFSASFAPATVDQGVPTRLDVSALGGAAASSVSYSGLPPGCGPSDRFVENCTPSENGTFAVVATVTDSLGESTSAVARLNVSSPLALATFIGKLPSHEVDVGVPVAMTTTAGQGTPPYNYTWNFGDGTNGTGSTVVHTFETSGEFVVTATVTDQGGGRTVNETVVTVEPSPSVVLSVAPGTTTDVGQELSLSATVTGGVGAGSGSWQFGDGTTSASTTADHSWSRVGLYRVNYTYTDALGATVGGNVSILVHAQPTGRFSIAPAASSPVVGTLFYFNATIANGTPEYTVTWSFGDGSTAVGTKVTHAYGASGDYRVNVSALDAAGVYVNSTFRNVTVGPEPSRSGALFGGGFGPSFALGLVIGAVLAAVALFIADRSRRAGPHGPPSPYVPPPPSPRRGRS